MIDVSMQLPIDGIDDEEAVDLSMSLPIEGIDDDVDLSPIEGMDHNEAARRAGPIFTPPPHIAARFYRPSQPAARTRQPRRGRGSISSTHSRSSQGFGRQAAQQSKYVAQHLRRASILEDRKARLADRAAHAEKVRLRAALAKAATRDTSASEERALAGCPGAREEPRRDRRRMCRGG